MDTKQQLLNSPGSGSRNGFIWIRRATLVCATVLSLAFASYNTSAHAGAASRDVVTLTAATVGAAAPFRSLPVNIGLVGGISIPDPFVDVVSLAGVGLGLVAIGRRLSRKPAGNAAAAAADLLLTEGPKL